MLVHYNQKSKTVQNVCVTCESEIPLTLDFEKKFSCLLSHSVLTKKLAIKYRLNPEHKFIRKTK